jgi:3-hydroxyisobutyrate dehydrogenase-like beta-hydroxyacid dehydrogenase
MKTAFIGLGVMGFPMAGYLAGCGYDVVVYNRSRDKVDRWLEQNDGRSAETPAEAARGADIVFCCVGNDDDVREVALGEHGAVHAMAPASILVDHTTASATLARELHAVAGKQQVGFLDAPLSGGQAGAENGQLTIMAGGDAAVFERAHPVMDSYAKAITLIGPAGSGQLAKMGAACEPRRREGNRRYLERRGAILADGQPLADHGERAVRFRIRSRLDA